MIQFDEHISQMGWFNHQLAFMCQGLNSHYFHIIGDGHQPNSRGLYTHYKDSYYSKGGMTIPNIFFYHGSYKPYFICVFSFLGGIEGGKPLTSHEGYENKDPPGFAEIGG